MQIIEKSREPWIPEKYHNNNHFTGKQLEYILKYGYYFCFEFFSPHFTVAGNDIDEKIFQKMKAELENRKEQIAVTPQDLAFFDRENANKIFLKLSM